MATNHQQPGDPGRYAVPSVRQIRAYLLLPLLALVLSGCDDDGTSPREERQHVLSSIYVTPASSTLFEVGATLALEARAVSRRNVDAPDVELVWSSSDPSVATVDTTGTVTAVSSGSVTITASAGAISGSAALLVDPEMVLQNYCEGCHRDHVRAFATAMCPACHSMILDPSLPEHSTVGEGHSAALTGFDLLGAHEAILCRGCHVTATGDLLYRPSAEDDCIACHQDEYQRQHAAWGFPSDCLSCHDVDAWSGASFDHTAASRGFALVGAHTSLPCTSCHDPASGDPLFSPTSQDDCYACHADDYQAEHGGSGYPTTCLTCHDVVVWTGASFDHDAQFFPIFTGDHRNKWSDCTDCHVNANDFSVFSCLGCHPKTGTDNKHSNVSGYVYDSDACYSCHPSP